MATIRILVADDHAILRSGLKRLLNAEPDMEVVAEAANGSEAIAQAKTHAPDLILLDLTMPGLSGTKAIPLLKEAAPGSKVLVLTMHEDEAHFYEAIQEGALGFVPKRAADTDLFAAIRAVCQGEVYIHPSFGKVVVQRLLEPEAGKVLPKEADALSRREKEVLALLARGYTNRQIADRLFLSIKTVETYKGRLMEKLGFHSRAELVTYALERGILAES